MIPSNMQGKRYKWQVAIQFQADKKQRDWIDVNLLRNSSEN